MPSSERRRRPALRPIARATSAIAVTIAIACALPARADAQQAAQGFAVERFDASPAGGGWLVMDALDMRGGLGGAVAITSGYARAPLRITDGVQRLSVVSDQAFAAASFAVTYDRFRLSLDLPRPMWVAGEDGTIGGVAFTAPATDGGKAPDAFYDVRLGFDARLVGGARDPLRLGVGARLFVPSGDRADYVTDGTFRAMGRLLVAGDVGALAYAGHLGVHVRPLDDDSVPGSPRGSELLFGAALGARVPVDRGAFAVVVGPEIFGETALRSFLGGDATGVEGLLSARVEGTRDDGGQLRVKLGAGAGLDAHFGAPEWRAVVAIELFDHHVDRDGDGVSDGKDACPDAPGPRTSDAANGCPPAHDDAR